MCINMVFGCHSAEVVDIVNRHPVRRGVLKRSATSAHPVSEADSRAQKARTLRKLGRTGALAELQRF